MIHNVSGKTTEIDITYQAVHSEKWNLENVQKKNTLQT